MADDAPTASDETEYPLPELTRALRSFGSARARPGSDHDRYFAPLLDPLRELRARFARAIALGTAGEPWRAAESVDAARAADTLRATLATLAAERFPSAAPDRRALEAELLDEAEPLFDALATLGDAGRRLRDADASARASEWRAWTGALAAAFVAADRSWARSVPALADSRGADGRLWRRVLRRGP